MILCFPVWRGRSGPHHAGWTSLLVVLSAVVIGAVALLNSSRLPVPVLADMTLSQDGRERIWQQSLEIFRDNWMTGTGSGTFSSAYALYEDPSLVTGVYVNHAHNEYLQIAVETGLAGCLLMAVTLILWGIASYRAWTTPDDGCRSLRRGASVSVLIILLHSLVDYPARTPALLVLGAALVFIQFFRPEPPPAANLPPDTRKTARGVVL
jgi:O-antigen ligase